MTPPIVLHDRQGTDFSPNANEEIYYKVTGDKTDGLFDYFDMRVGHFEGFPLHIHIKQHETFHVFEGELLLQIGQDFFTAKEGDFVMVPKNTVHTFTNIRKKPARTVGVISPGGFDKFVAEMMAMTKASGGRQDPKKVDEICARHDQKFVGPPLAVALGLLPEPNKAVAVKEDLSKLEGNWKLVGHTGHGAKWLAEHGGKFAGGLRLDGNLLEFWVEGGRHNEGITKIDPTKTPKTIDIFHLNKEDKGRTGLGIYEFNGEVLRMCWAVAGLLDKRPEEFPTNATESMSFNTYERVKG